MTEVEVHAVEAEVGALPSGYRSLLQRFGWVSFGHFEIYGAGTALPHYLDVVFMAKHEWEHGGLSRHLVPIMNNGGGDLYCVAGAEVGGADEAVHLWVHEERSTHPVAGDMEEWITGMAAAIDARS